MSPRPRLLIAASSLALVAVAATIVPRAQQAQPAPRPFNGITTGVGDLSRLSKAKTRSIPRALRSRAMHPAELSAESFVMTGTLAGCRYLQHIKQSSGSHCRGAADDAVADHG